jgi:hypothetical protein
MSLLPIAPDAERARNSIDRFAALTVQASEEAVRRARGMLSTLGFLCLVLFLSLVVVVWRANAMEQERDRLVVELRNERAARVEATLAAKGVEMNVATYALDTQARRDIVDGRMLEQEQRSSELARLAAKVERDKLIEADCVTPRSILTAAGL